MPIDTVNFDKSDIIQIYCYDNNNIDGRLIYTGFISRIKRWVDSGGERIELVCL